MGVPFTYQVVLLLLLLGLFFLVIFTFSLLNYALVWVFLPSSYLELSGLPGSGCLFPSQVQGSFQPPSLSHLLLGPLLCQYAWFCPMSLNLLCLGSSTARYSSSLFFSSVSSSLLLNPSNVFFSSVTGFYSCDFIIFSISFLKFSLCSSLLNLVNIIMTITLDFYQVNYLPFSLRFFQRFLSFSSLWNIFLFLHLP